MLDDVYQPKTAVIISLRGMMSTLAVSDSVSGFAKLITRPSDWAELIGHWLNCLALSDTSRNSLQKIRKRANRQKAELSAASVFTRMHEHVGKRGRLATEGREALVKESKRNGSRLPDLFQLMRSSPLGDWDLRDFTSKHPDCVGWKEPVHEMVPLLYAISIRSRWLIRHFMQLDRTKIFEKDKSGRDALDIAVDADDIGILAYISNQLGESPRDPHASPLELEDPYADIPDGLEGMREVHRRHKEFVDQHNARKASDNVVDFDKYKQLEP